MRKDIYERMKTMKEIFLCIRRFTSIKDIRFSKPYNNWHLSKEDEDFITSLESNL